MFREPSRKRARPHGDSKWLAPMLGYGFAAGASALGFGALAGPAAQLGMSIGQGIKDITGFGAYQVNKNSLMNGEVPNVHNPATAENGLTISHKEFIGDVITSTTAGAFAISGFDLNPANAQVWEWLAQIAGNFEEWKPEGILFYYKSTSADALNSTNTALGNVIMATNYNVYNPDFTTKAEMEAYQFCTSGTPSEDMIHPVECDPSQGSISTYYMNVGPVNTGIQDQRFNKLGKFYIATVGFQAAKVNIGELWVTYQVTLLKPKLYNALGLYNDYLMVTPFEYATYQPVGTGIFQPTTNLRAVINIPFTYYTASSGLWLENGANSGNIHFPVYAYKTRYVVMIHLRLSVGAATPSLTPLPSSGNYDTIYAPVVDGNIWGNQAGPSTNRYTWVFDVTVPGGFICNDLQTPYVEFLLSAALTQTWQSVLMVDQRPNVGRIG